MGSPSINNKSSFIFNENDFMTRFEKRSNPPKKTNNSQPMRDKELSEYFLKNILLQNILLQNDGIVDYDDFITGINKQYEILEEELSDKDSFVNKQIRIKKTKKSLNTDGVFEDLDNIPFMKKKLNKIRKINSYIFIYQNILKADNKFLSNFLTKIKYNSTMFEYMKENILDMFESQKSLAKVLECLELLKEKYIRDYFEIYNLIIEDVNIDMDQSDGKKKKITKNIIEMGLDFHKNKQDVINKTENLSIEDFFKKMENEKLKIGENKFLTMNYDKGGGEIINVTLSIYDIIHNDNMKTIFCDGLQFTESQYYYFRNRLEYCVMYGLKNEIYMNTRILLS